MIAANYMKQDHEKKMTNAEKLIYIADDNKDCRELYYAILREQNYDVKLFDSGNTLIEAIIKSIPDLIIMDTLTPACTHIDVYRFLNTRGVQTPILFISGGEHCPYFDCLPKPFHIKELLSKIEQITRN